MSTNLIIASSLLIIFGLKTDSDGLLRSILILDHCLASLLSQAPSSFLSKWIVSSTLALRVLYETLTAGFELEGGEAQCGLRCLVSLEFMSTWVPRTKHFREDPAERSWKLSTKARSSYTLLLIRWPENGSAFPR